MASRFPTPFQAPSRNLRAPDPFSDLHREMNRLFDDFFSFGAPTPGTATLAPMPRLDVRETDQEICISAELPGVKPADVDVRVEGNLLTIRGEKKNEAEQQQQQQDYHLMERSYGRFQRSLQLPFQPDPGQVRASFEDGVLTVHVPRQAQQERSRRIEIQAGAGAQHAAVGGSATGSGDDAGNRPDPMSHH
ncbi:Hsp20/alpha crystallin family protein [Ramlibacter tataouinensis]|uniref:Heat shock protein-like protein n=1 Tax=Ramlibacter tataouinensis (strain ATCC BAA-407 / DSM 14655 / LMG 21543 / TTB310) TaxID=365046 RepID=F5XZN8_RAMTT|nr:Hsp20/alpha crystallin family protein [Ramlibacter tataouinensis]AEG92067.1 heat shock protein-like protein [Ramlibacter tataouinensis TTB310]